MKKNKYIQFEDGSVLLKKERKVSTKELIISIVLALAIFLCLLIAEGKYLSNYATSPVIVTNSAIAGHTQITDNNVYQLFSVKEIPSNLVPQNAITTIEQLVGKVIFDDLNSGEILVNNRFSDEEKFLAAMKAPLEMGISVSNASQIVGGIIRKGDFVNISVLDDNTKESIYILKNMYVSKAFNGDGVEILDAGKDIEALKMNIYIDESEEQYFNKMIAKGDLIISKVLTETENKETRSVQDQTISNSKENNSSVSTKAGSGN